jgi:murein L,D-transpeptidase YafK
MRIRFLFPCLLLVTIPFVAYSQLFKREQTRFPRVKAAIEEKEFLLRELCTSKKLSYPPKEMLIRIFKYEQGLEVWVRYSVDSSFTLLKEYRICRLSGILGPKREQGDSQVPEGFYVVSGFNPNSNFHLSLKINYPNKSDRILGVRGNLGGDIFIHGNCVTVGCVPITDDWIKEVYLLAVEAHSAGQKSIPVHVFPVRMNEEGMNVLRKNFPADEPLLDFWNNLKTGYDYFEKYRLVPSITVDSGGKYVVEK